MKKHILSIFGIVIQCIGIGLILFNINSENQVYLWTGFPLVFIGLAITLIGLFLNRDKEK